MLGTDDLDDFPTAPFNYTPCKDDISKLLHENSLGKTFVRDELETKWKNVLEFTEDFIIGLQPPQRWSQLTPTKCRST